MPIEQKRRSGIKIKLTFCCRHSLHARFTGCLFFSSRSSLSSISSMLPGELSNPAMVTLRFLACPRPSGPTAECPTPPITGLVAALSCVPALSPNVSPCPNSPPPPIPLDDPPIDARLSCVGVAGCYSIVKLGRCPRKTRMDANNYTVTAMDGRFWLSQRQKGTGSSQCNARRPCNAAKTRFVKLRLS